MVRHSIQKAPVEGSWFHVILSDKPKYWRTCNV